jgi:hypothetical protein
MNEEGVCSCCTNTINAGDIWPADRLYTKRKPNHCTTGPTPYEHGQAVGAPIGSALGAMIARHNQIKNYCRFHPGESWHDENYAHGGTCKVAKAKHQTYPTAWCAVNPDAMYSDAGKDMNCKR